MVVMEAIVVHPMRGVKALALVLAPTAPLLRLRHGDAGERGGDAHCFRETHAPRECKVALSKTYFWLTISAAIRCASFAAGMPQYSASSSSTSRISSGVAPLASAPRTCTANSAGRLIAAVMPSTTKLLIFLSSPGRLQMSP